MTRSLHVLCIWLFFGSGPALAQETQPANDVTAGEESAEPAEDSERTVREVPVNATSADISACDGSVEEIVARVEAASTSEQRAIVDACFERFNQRAEVLRDSRDSGLVYSETSSELELQLRLLQAMSRQLEPGGRLERNIAALETEISDLQTQADLQRPRFPDRAEALDATIQELSDEYDSSVDRYVNLRASVSEQMTELTTFRPIIALELRAEGLAEVLDELAIAIQAATTAMTGIIDANENERETE